MRMIDSTGRGYYRRMGSWDVVGKMKDRSKKGGYMPEDPEMNFLLLAPGGMKSSP